MSDNDSATSYESDAVPLLGEMWRRNLMVIMAQHFHSSLSTMSEASAKAEEAAVANGEEPVGKMGISTLSRWSNGKALVDRLNKIDIQMRRLGISGLDGYSLVRGYGGVEHTPVQQEVFFLLAEVPALRLRGLMQLLRLITEEEPDAEKVHAEVDAFLRNVRIHAELSSGIQAIYENLSALAMSPDEQKDLLAQVDHLTEKISNYSQR